LDYYLFQTLNMPKGDKNSTYSELEIIQELFDKTGFRLQPETLRREIRKYIKTYGESLLEPVFKVNFEFFERYPPKPPKHYNLKNVEKNPNP